MKIVNGIHITISNDGKLFTNLLGGWKHVTDEKIEAALKTVYKAFRSKKFSETTRVTALQEALDLISKLTASNENDSKIIENIPTVDKNREKLHNCLNQLIDFFKDFEFEPNFRFVNTLSNALNYSISYARSYISNYFELSDNRHFESVKEKIKSTEFKNLMTDLRTIKTEKKVNMRFKIYYGSQGTGKTTEAMNEANDIMVCHSAMLPSDLMEDFEFNDGKAEFSPSALYNAMKNGTQIVLDEINLLPFESLRFLQSLLDGKKHFIYKGKTIEIKDGFKIIGTMNLSINGSTFGLPEPLVDRCECIKKYTLTADNLIEAIL